MSIIPDLNNVHLTLGGMKIAADTRTLRVEDMSRAARQLWLAHSSHTRRPRPLY
jgi:hypothetical protein